MIHPQPQCPGVVVKRQRKTDPHREQDREYGAVTEVREQQTREVYEENENFGGDYIRHDRANEEPFFAFEDHTARRADVLEVERALDDRSAAADWALQLKTAPKREPNRARFSFHNAVIPADRRLTAPPSSLRRSDIFIAAVTEMILSSGGAA
jgi:hypothetical protein